MSAVGKLNPDMPFSLNFEQSVLGALLLKPEVFATVELSADLFHRPDHRHIYTAIERLHTQGVAWDAVVIADELERVNQTESTGGLAYVGELAANQIGTGSIEYHVQRLHDYAKKRAALRIGESLVKSANDPAGAESIANRHMEQLRKITDTSQKSPNSHASRKEPWPKDLAKEAYHGLFGEMVRAIEPQTESDPAAILLQLIVAFGVLVGRYCYVPVEGDRHFLNLFLLLVGKSSKARKGTSWGRVKAIFSRLASMWCRVVNGLSSGEGLKYAVRDPITKMERDKKTGHTEEVQVDAGVADKRLLVVESEFAQILRQVARAGNTLSATIRAAWDTGDLMTLTKNDPVTATGAHIAIIGHITDDELRAELTATDSANGFANRFLFQCVQRSKSLPFGGDPLPEDVLANFAARVADVVAHAQSLGAVQMSATARKVWEAVYPKLSEGKPGLLGAVTARAEAHCLRLALAYAMADKATEIEPAHLKAAIAIVERVEASARYIFGAAIGDRVADDILRELRIAGQEGCTRTQISGLFQRHESTERIGAALELLASRNLAQVSQKHSNGGRPTEIWRSTDCETSELAN